MSEFHSELTPSFVEICYGPHQGGIVIRLGDISPEYRVACLELLDDGNFTHKAALADPKRDPLTPINELQEQLTQSFPIHTSDGANSEFLLGPHPTVVLGVGIWALKATDVD